MRTLSADTGIKVQADGKTPILVVKVLLPGGAARYSDRDLTLDNIILDGRISKASELRTTVKIDQGSRIVGTVGTMSVQLLDNDLLLKTFMDSHDLQGTYVNVYHWFGGQSQSDMLLLLKGRIEQPPTWSEDDRTLDFEIETPRRIKPIPFAPLESDGLDMNLALLGKPWPMVFGTPSDVPAVLVKEPARGTLVQDINEIGVFEDQNVAGQPHVNVKVATTVFEVDNPLNDFPQGTTQLVKIGDEYVEGSFSGNTLTVTRRQVNRYTGLPVYGNGEILTLPAGVRAVGSYVTIRDLGTETNNPTTSVASFNFVYPQLTDINVIGGGTPWPDATSPRVVYRAYCYKQIGTSCYMWMGNSSFIPEQMVADVNRYPFTPEDGAQWVLKAGSPVVCVDQPVIYVVNQLVSEAVIRCRAWRQVRRDDHSGYSKREVVAIDAANYKVNLNDSAYLGATTITFDEKLSDREAGWEDELFVTLRSTQGPNTADILKYLVNNHSEGTLTAGASFTAVRTDLVPYPSHFAIRNQEDVLQHVGDIAWQARCGVTWNGATANLVYLSKEPTVPATTLADSTLAEGGFKLLTTRIEDVITVFNVTWRPNYSDPQAQRIMVQTNVARYGKREETFDFWIYQSRSLVNKSAQFWAKRRGYIWRMLDADSWGLETIGIDPLDYCRWNVTGFFTNVLGLCVESGMRAWDHTGVGLVLPIEAGTVVKSSNFWTSDSGDAAPSLPNYTAGAAEAEIMQSPPPEVIVPASRPGSVPTNDTQVQEIFVVVATADEETDPSDPDWKRVWVRIKSATELDSVKRIKGIDFRISEIDFLDPSGINFTMATEKAALESEKEDLLALLDRIVPADNPILDGQVLGAVHADNPSVSYMLEGDTGSMVKIGGSYVVTPDNATGPHIAAVTKKKASPAEATLSADIAGAIKNGPQGSVQIQILGDSDPEVGDKILVFRDAAGAYYTSGSGTGVVTGMAKVLQDSGNKDAIPVGIFLTGDFTGDPSLTLSAKMPQLGSPYVVPAGTWAVALKLSDGTWTLQIPVVLPYAV